MQADTGGIQSIWVCVHIDICAYPNIENSRDLRPSPCLFLVYIKTPKRQPQDLRLSSAN